VQLEWRHFIKNGHAQSDQIRKVITDSWRRSQHAGVSINTPEAPVILQSHDLEEYLFNHKKLLQASIPILKPASRFSINISHCWIIMI
jgi:transcriptional regulator of acetoin/glycerol metabolism